MNLVIVLATALCSHFLTASNLNDDLYSQNDFGSSELCTLIKEYASNDEEFSPPLDLLKDAYTVNGEDQVYWLPETKTNKLFDVVDLKNSLVPVLSGKHPVYEHFFTYALLAQYIIPSWLEEFALSSRDTLLIQKLAPFITTRLRKYFQHVVWAVYFQTGQVSRDSSELMSTLYTHMSDLGLNMRHLPMMVLNTTHYRKQADSAPFRNVLTVAKHWDMNLKIISKAMHFKPEKNDMDMLEDQESGPSSKDVLQSILPKGSELIKFYQEAEVVELTLRFPRASVDAVLLKSLVDVEMENSENTGVRTRGQKRMADSGPRSPPNKRSCVVKTFEVPPTVAIVTEASAVNHSMPSLEDAMIFSEFINRVHYQHHMMVNQAMYSHVHQMSPPMYLKMRLGKKKNK